MSLTRSQPIVRLTFPGHPRAPPRSLSPPYLPPPLLPTRTRPSLFFSRARVYAGAERAVRRHPRGGLPICRGSFVKYFLIQKRLGKHGTGRNRALVVLWMSYNIYRCGYRVWTKKRLTVLRWSYQRLAIFRRQCCLWHLWSAQEGLRRGLLERHVLGGAVGFRRSSRSGT